MLEAGTVIRPNPRVVHRNLAGGAGGVLLHLDTAAYHGVNEIGSTIWSLLASEATFEQLVRTLPDHLESTPTSLEADVSAFLHELRERDLITFHDAVELSRIGAAQPQP